MEFKREVLKAQMETVEITCDCCGRKDSDFRKVNDEPLPMITLEGFWGYSSKKDLEYHKAWICEECYDKMISHFNIKPLVKEYRPGAWRGPREAMYVNITDEAANGSIIDPATDEPRYESEEWQAKNKEKSEPVDKLRDWAKAFLAKLEDAEYYSGPPPEGDGARNHARKIAQELKELLK